MSELRERLDDLLDATPSYVVADAGAAWRAGARRRHRRQVGAGVLVVVLVLLAGLGVGALPRPAPVDPADTDGAGVDGYPTRIADPWRIGDLPDAPGPMAGIVVSSEHGRLGVTPGGRLLRIPEGDTSDTFPPILSDDGRHLAYLVDVRTYVVHDLVAGTRTVVPGLGDNSGRSDEPYLTYGQTPGFWSPDGERLLLMGSRRGRGATGSFLLVDADGTLSVLPDLPSWSGSPVGWLSEDRLGWLVEGEASGAVDLLVTDDRAREVDRVNLGARRLEAGSLNQWSGSVSPDGRSLLLVVGGRGAETDVVLDTRTGTQTWSGRVGSLWDCPTTWYDGLPVDVRSGGLVDRSGRTLVTTDPAVGAGCVGMSGVALAGDPHRGVAGLLFGTRTGWLAWHWHEAGLGVLVLLAGIALVVRRRRVSGSAAPGSA